MLAFAGVVPPETIDGIELKFDVRFGEVRGT